MNERAIHTTYEFDPLTTPNLPWVHSSAAKQMRACVITTKISSQSEIIAAERHSVLTNGITANTIHDCLAHVLCFIHT